MSLRFVYGRSGSGKSRFCLDEINKSLESGGDRPLVLIVPEQFSQQAERNLIMSSGRNGMIRAEVLSFRRIAYRVFNETGGRVRKSISQSGKNMVLSRILENRSPELRAFGLAAKQKGFVKTISDMITEFRRYSVTPEALEGMSVAVPEGAEGPERLLSDKLHDLSVIYRDFEEALAGRFADAEDDLTLLCDKLDKAEHFKDAEIWIDEFTGFTPQEYNVVKKLLTVAKRVTITLCIDKPDSRTDFLFEPVGNTSVRLSAIAAQAGSAVEEAVFLKVNRRHSNDGTLSHLERNLFAYPAEKLEGKANGVSILAASNMFDEVEDTARSIIALCRDKGYRYRDIAVVSRAVENYEKAIEAVFKQYGIPHFLDRKKDIMSNPMVIFILSALEIIKSNWSYQPVFRYIKTGLTCLTRDEADLLENYVLSNGIRGGRWTRPEQWSFKPERSFPGENDEERSGKEAEYLEKINAYRAAVATPLANFHNALKASKKAEDACTALYDLLVANGLLQKVEELSEGFASAGNIAMANEYRQVWEAVMELLDQLVEVAGDLPVDVAGFTALLEAGLGEYGIGLVPASLDQVLVGSVERSKSHEIKALFVIGANDGVFPAAASEEGILSDDERNRLAAAGIELAKDSKSKAYEERLLVYTTLSTPSEELRVSWTASDMESRAMRPSRIISDLKRILPGIDVRSNIAGSRLAIDERELIAAPAPAFNELVAAVRRQQDGKTVNGREADPDVVHKEGNSERQDGTPEYRSEKLWAAAYKWFSGSDDWKAHTARIFSGLGQTGGISPVMRDKALKLYGNPMFSSVSRLETYSACPFSYFVQYGLKAQERNIFSWKPVDVGTFMHAVLEEFSAVLETEGVSWRDLDREWCEKRISMIVDALLEKMTGTVFTSSKRYLWLTSRLKNIITRAALLTAEHFKRSCFEPVSYEADFREGGRFPPITICLPSGETMRLTGRIDRIDKYEDGENTYLRIVDYKSGNKALKLADVYYGLQLQLLTYMDAVLGEMDTGGVLSNGALACGEMDTGGVLANGAPSGGEMDTGSVLPGGVLYFRLDDPIISGDRTLNEADIETAIKKALRTKGLLLADVKLIRAMDRDLSGDSMIIPARINKGDILGRSSAASREQFGLLRSHIRKTLAGLGAEIVKGNVAASPYKKRNVTACTWCAYSAVCQFDLSLKDNKYRILRELDDDQVWNRIRNELSHDNGEDVTAVER